MNGNVSRETQQNTIPAQTVAHHAALNDVPLQK